MGAPAEVKAEMELLLRLVIQTRFEPSMAMPDGALRPPPVYPPVGEMGLPVLSDSPRALLLLPTNQTLSEESMATGVSSLEVFAAVAVSENCVAIGGAARR